LDAANYNEYKEKYSGASMERSHFIAICGFFELSGSSAFVFEGKIP
jgi:hypothetical protein